MKKLYLKKYSIFIIFLLCSSFLFGCLSNDPEELYKKGLSLNGQGKTKKALMYFDKAVQLESDNYQYWLTIGDTTIIFNNEKALEAFSKVIQLNPKITRAWDAKLYILREQNKHEELINHIDEMIIKRPWQDGNINTSDKLYSIKAVTLVKLQKYEEALEMVNRMAELSKDRSTWLLKVDLLNKLGRYDEAAEASRTLRSMPLIYGPNDMLD